MAEKEENKQVNLFESSLETDFSKPKTLDTSGLEKQIQKIQTPTSSNVYDKLAALYRQETQGRSLRETTDLQRALLPAAELYRQREEEANERFAELVEQIPTFDDSTLYGEKTGGVGFESEIMGASNEIRNDLRLLSRLNPADPRYSELAQKVRQKQNNIIKYNDLNQKLLDIRNSEIEPSEISNTYSAAEKEAYRQIRLGSTENIAFKNGKLIFTYTDGGTTTEVDIDKLDINPFEGSYDTRSDDLELQGMAVDMGRNGIGAKDSFGRTKEYNTLMSEFERFKSQTSNKNILGLILDGNTDKSSYRNINTVEFVNSLDGAGVSIQELQSSRDLSKVVDINGVKQSIRKHFFDFYLNNLNNAISSSEKQSETKSSTNIKNILLTEESRGFNNRDFSEGGFYDNISRSLDISIDNNNQTVFIPKEDIIADEAVAKQLNLVGNVFKKGQSYAFDNKEDLKVIEQQISKNIYRSGENIVNIDISKAENYDGKVPGGSSFISRVTVEDGQAFLQPRRVGDKILANDLIQSTVMANLKIATVEDIEKIIDDLRNIEMRNRNIESAPRYKEYTRILNSLKNKGYSVNMRSLKFYFEQLKNIV